LEKPDFSLALKSNAIVCSMKDNSIPSPLFFLSGYVLASNSTRYLCFLLLGSRRVFGTIVEKNVSAQLNKRTNLLLGKNGL